MNHNFLVKYTRILIKITGILIDDNGWIRILLVYPLSARHFSQCTGAKYSFRKVDARSTTILCVSVNSFVILQSTIAYCRSACLREIARQQFSVQSLFYNGLGTHDGRVTDRKTWEACMRRDLQGRGAHSTRAFWSRVTCVLRPIVIRP